MVSSWGACFEQINQNEIRNNKSQQARTERAEKTTKKQRKRPVKRHPQTCAKHKNKATKADTTKNRLKKKNVKKNQYKNKKTETNSKKVSTHKKES